MKAVTVDEAVEADIILVAVGAVAFKDVGAVLRDWSGKIVIDVTNGFMLPLEVQQAEYQGRLTSEVNAKRVPGSCGKPWLCQLSKSARLQKAAA